MPNQDPRTLSVDFAGEVCSRQPGERLTVGRVGDLTIDDNPYLHRHFLLFEVRDRLWWIHNVGTHLAAYLADLDGYTRSVLGPGASLPLVRPPVQVTFAAGGTSYELVVTVGVAPVEQSVVDLRSGGDRTVLPTALTELQLLALVALAEPVLRRTGSGTGEIPTSPQAAARIGWTVKRFDKKIENLCDKLSAAGVSGLRGQTDRVAANRRRHLVEYAVSTRIVTPHHLALLDQAPRPEEDNE